MTHDELIDCITKSRDYTSKQEPNVCMKEELNALLAAVRLHKPELIEGGKESIFICLTCCNPAWFWKTPYPCLTIQAIEKELE